MMHQKKVSRNKIVIFLITISLASLTIYLSILFFTEKITELKSKYDIQYFGTHTQYRWPAWQLNEGQTLYVKIINSAHLPDDKIKIVRDTILSSERSAESTPYVGWQGALNEAAQNPTMLYVPIQIEITDSFAGSGITITLVNQKNKEGYSGYTNSIVVNDYILKSDITLYNVNELSEEQLATIARHEFGHALGLTHAVEPDDLMHETIRVPSFVSDCDVDAIVGIYNAERDPAFECEKFGKHT